MRLRRDIVVDILLLLLVTLTGLWLVIVKPTWGHWASSERPGEISEIGWVYDPEEAETLDAFKVTVSGHEYFVSPLLRHITLVGLSIPYWFTVEAIRSDQVTGPVRGPVRVLDGADDVCLTDYDLDGKLSVEDFSRAIDLLHERFNETCGWQVPLLVQGIE
jgi:hypothetical protein